MLLWSPALFWVFLQLAESIVFLATHIVGLVFIWSFFGFCLLFPLLYIIYAPVPTEAVVIFVIRGCVFVWTQTVTIKMDCQYKTGTADRV